ncbi:MAG: phage integrase N-terminal SAM-like domain-containing protein [Thermoanaerobaculia bacterium]
MGTFKTSTRKERDHGHHRTAREDARHSARPQLPSRTEETYIAAVIHFARHFGTPPDQLGAEHVIAYQVWLRDQKALRSCCSTRSCARCGSLIARFSTALTSWNALATRVTSVGCRSFCRSRRSIELLRSIDHPR